MSEKETSRLPDVTIQVESKFDPSTPGTCPFDNKPLVRKQVDYQLELHGKIWTVPRLWISTCGTEEHVLLSLEDGKAIDEKIFEMAFPREHQLGQLLPD